MTRCHGWPCKYKSSKPWHLNSYHEVVPISNCNLRHFFALVFQLHMAIQIKLDFYCFPICGTRPITKQFWVIVWFQSIAYMLTFDINTFPFLTDITHYCTQGHLTRIFPTFPNPIVNLDFHTKTDPGLSWVSNNR